IATCTYLFSDIGTGWRTRYWTAADCTNGLPAVGAPSVGNGMNGGGTAGMVDCQPAYGQHFNHSTYDGATNGQVSCTYLNPAAQTAPEFTLCQASFPELASGWRTHTWTASDCSHGLPNALARGIGMAANGAGTREQAYCTPTSGSHYNIDVTSGTVRCLYENPLNTLTVSLTSPANNSAASPPASMSLQASASGGA